DLTGVALSGSLPCSISRLTALEYLYIGMPQFHVSTDPFLSHDPTDILSAQSSMRPPVMQGSMDDLSCLAPLTRLQDLYASLHPNPPSPSLSLIPAFVPFFLDQAAS
ncbi:unnamed protein product, partial [Closterium sp. NIES-65]